jgi:hypothetical protein
MPKTLIVVPTTGLHYDQFHPSLEGRAAPVLTRACVLILPSVAPALLSAELLVARQTCTGYRSPHRYVPSSTRVAVSNCLPCCRLEFTPYAPAESP